ncbi:hypothetical protein DFH08DRAFT_975271 [Mycena albidolilacea]|uniref:Uncharacterized protein n=1 Tax=Mycena albidolilacea TaxID=1033008 RepID=A0AAD6Z5H6_9AGAR|nr:hypothetical protein DFH08DRAFT_975271 [Mycena albidolilacea]
MAMNLITLMARQMTDFLRAHRQQPQPQVSAQGGGLKQYPQEQTAWEAQAQAQLQLQQQREIQAQLQASALAQAQGGGPKYITDLSKALSIEVKILLEEVGKLRDERRAMQFEVEELRVIRARYGGPPSTASAGYIGGPYGTNASPQTQLIPEPEPGPPVPPHPPAPGAWRVVHPPPAMRRPAPKAPTKHKKIAAAAPAPPPAVTNPQPNANLPAWAQWRPNPLLVPASTGTEVRAPPPREGLFGPKTPPPRR